MKIEYSIKMRCTRKVLKDYVKFTYAVNYPKTTFRLCVLAGGFFVLAMFMDQYPKGAFSCVVLGIAIALFAFMRHKIAMGILLKSDERYKKESSIQYEFGSKEFVVKASEALEEKKVIEYNELASLYKDRGNYYLCIKSGELYILPFEDFVQGNYVQFEKYLSRITRLDIIPLHLPIREKLRQINNSRKEMEQLHDKKIEEKKNKRKKR